MHSTVGNLTIVVVGASGDLARKKVYPALFALYCQGYLPAGFRVFGFARSAFTNEEFRAKIAENLTCRYAPGESCAERMSEFLGRCHYLAGDYASRDAFLDLFAAMQAVEGEPPVYRIFYLAIPSGVFLDVAHSIGGAGMVSCDPQRPWSRVVIEKPFGRDRESSDRLTEEMGRVFAEGHTFRIDHYLGKEVIQNLMVLRFANLVFEPIWNRDFVKSVHISWKEDIGVEGRGGYFDSYGIIRDVMQNHLLQILSLVAMEPPVGLQASHVRDEKVKVLRAIPPIELRDIAVGQYTAGRRGDRAVPGYREDPTVPPDSATPTYAAAVLRIRNRRWDGVPFVIEAGKAMNARINEIRIRFREVPGNIFRSADGAHDDNELVIRVQPDEAIYLRLVHKVPGLATRLASRNLDLRYEAAFSEIIPDAYESLLLDVIRGEKGLFIRGDELAAAWDIFTPALHELESRRAAPEPYAFGSGGPAAARRLVEPLGIEPSA